MSLTKCMKCRINETRGTYCQECKDKEKQKDEEDANEYLQKLEPYTYKIPWGHYDNTLTFKGNKYEIDYYDNYVVMVNKKYFGGDNTFPISTNPLGIITDSIWYSWRDPLYIDVPNKYTEKIKEGIGKPIRVYYCRKGFRCCYSENDIYHKLLYQSHLICVLTCCDFKHDEWIFEDIRD